jgi:hypothetical protein
VDGEHRFDVRAERMPTSVTLFASPGKHRTSSVRRRGFRADGEEDLGGGRGLAIRFATDGAPRRRRLPSKVVALGEEVLETRVAGLDPPQADSDGERPR